MTTLEMNMRALCSCGHTDRMHDSDGMCLDDNDCDCLTFKPSEGAIIFETPQAPVPVQQRSDDLTALLSRGRRSQHKRTSSLAAKIAGMLDDLRTRIDAESADAKIVKEIADLEAKLAAAKAQLRGGVAPARTETVGRPKLPCPDCDGTFAAQGLGVHRAKAHGVRKAVA